MMLWDSVEIASPHAAIFIPSLKMLVIADLHLGYEAIMAEQGLFVPRVQFLQELEVLEELRERYDADRILLDGDIKHEFSETGYHEFVEVRDLFSFLTGHFREVLVVKGNHDNFLVRITKRFGIVPQESISVGEFLFVHGHQPLPETRTLPRHLVIGHEHPALLLFDEVGARERLGCLLYGEIGDRRLVVLPAFSPLAEGNPVNVIPAQALLSPVLREQADIDRMRAIGISREAGPLSFPEIGRLRGI